MYGNMRDYEAFRANVVKDDRSYSDETFASAVKILNNVKRNISVGAVEKQKFEALVE